MTEIEILKLRLQHYIKQEKEIIDLCGGDHKHSSLKAVRDLIAANKTQNYDLNYFQPSHPRLSRF